MNGYAPACPNAFHKKLWSVHQDIRSKDYLDNRNNSFPTLHWHSRHWSFSQCKEMGSSIVNRPEILCIPNLKLWEIWPMRLLFIYHTSGILHTTWDSAGRVREEISESLYLYLFEPEWIKPAQFQILTLKRINPIFILLSDFIIESSFVTFC